MATACGRRKRAKGASDKTHSPADLEQTSLDSTADNTMNTQTPADALLQFMAQQSQMQLERWNREDKAREDRRREKEQEREEERRQLERDREEERRQREADREADLNQRQMEFRHLTETMTALTVAQAKPKIHPPKLEPMGNGEMIDAEFHRFEAHMATFDIPDRDWLTHLRPLLKDDALAAFMTLTPAEMTYASAKEAILQRMGITKETHMKKWWEATIKSDESVTQLACRLQDLGEKCLADCTTMREAAAVFSKERLYRLLPTNIACWIRSQKPHTARDAGILGDQYIRDHSLDYSILTKIKPFKPEKKVWERAGYRKEEQPHAGKNPKEEIAGASTLGPFNQPKADRKQDLSRYFDNKKGPMCFNCHEWGHIGVNCPKKLFPVSEVKLAKIPWQPALQLQLHVMGRINGISCDRLRLDSGATITIVHAKFIQPHHWVGETAHVVTALGQVQALPRAQVTLELQGQTIPCNVAVAESLTDDALLGTDIPSFLRIFQTESDKYKQQLSQADAVVTCQQARDMDNQLCQEQRASDASGASLSDLALVEQEEEAAADPTTDCTGPDALIVQEEIVQEAEAPIDPTTDCPGPDASIVQEEEAPINPTTDCPWPDDMFGPSRSRPKLTRSQKRVAAHTRAAAMLSHDTTQPQGSDLAQEQDHDESLQKARESAGQDGSAYYYQGRWLYHRSYDKLGNELQQLVLPQSRRTQAIKIAHSVPMAGHLGRRRTTARLLRRFFWPGIHKSVAEACRSCPVCQKAARKPSAKAPLQPLPVISEPFERVAIDIVGPLPRTKSGFKYLLTMVDYGTRYPEAVPLRSTDSASVATALMGIFTRLGVPKEVLTDQGSNFLSSLMEELYRMLGTRHLKTSPYHPQTNGAVERFHGTLKHMLRKTTTDKRDWDTVLPSVLFAFREVPCASTGFSPFDLMFGRHVRGPLDILQAAWSSDQAHLTTAATWVQEMRQRLDDMRTVAWENQHKEQANMQKRYNKGATPRTLEVGDQVLALLPAGSGKLDTQWHGPYVITAQVSPVTYQVDMPEKRKRHRTFHVNMLKQWNSPVASVLAVCTEQLEESDGHIVMVGDDCEGIPTLGQQLSQTQVQELQQLINTMPEVFTDKPGRTTAAEHCIDTADAQPVRIPPYRIPKAWEEQVKLEIRTLLDMGIIEPCRSPWASPIVAVGKKDGSLRLCVDYRRVNAVTKDDPYPMPRVDDLIENLGKSRYISTLDLAKGYYQVPVRDEDKDKTAFLSPHGKYRFLTMPFGLKGAPTTFQRLMDQVLDGLDEFAAGFIDDMVIFSMVWGEHLTHLRTVLGRLKHDGLTAKARKCQLAMQSCVFLGHVVGEGCVRPEQAKVEAVREFQQPRTKKDVRAFLGLAGYYRRFLPNFSSITACLSDLTKSTAPNIVEWTSDCDQAFRKLKASLSSQPVLANPDYDRPFILQTDASERGIGAVLSQKTDDDFDKPIAYFSRKLLPRETRYASIEKECLAIVAALQHFQPYLLGRMFYIQTDHRALVYIERMRNTNGRLMRWALALQPFSYTVVYRPGSQNANADALSRQSWIDDVTPPEGGGSVRELPNN